MADMYWDETYWSSPRSKSVQNTFSGWVGTGSRSQIISVEVKVTMSDPLAVGKNTNAVYLGANLTYVADGPK